MKTWRNIAIISLLLFSTSLYREVRSEATKQLTRFEYESQMAECFNFNEQMYGEEVVNANSNIIFNSCRQQIVR